MLIRSEYFYVAATISDWYLYCRPHVYLHNYWNLNGTAKPLIRLGIMSEYRNAPGDWLTWYTPN